MGQMDCTSEQVLVIYGGKRTVELMEEAPWSRVQQHSGGAPGQGREILRLPLHQEFGLGDASCYIQNGETTGSSPGRTTALVYQQLPRLRIPFPSWQLANSNSRFKVLLRGPLPRLSLPLCLRKEAALISTVALITLFCNCCLYLSLPLDCELLKGRDQGLFFLLTIPVPTTGPDAQ